MRDSTIQKMKTIAEYIEAYYSKNGRSPTIRDIATDLECSLGGLHQTITKMIDNGMLEQAEGARKLRTKRMVQGSSNVFRDIPQVGYVSCGMLMTSEENIERYLPFPMWGLNPNKEYFFLQASGDSMKGAGIDSGDLVLVQKQEDANNGDIVVALTEEGETTLKRLYYDNFRQQVVLHPENRNYQDTYWDVVYVQGVVVKIIKDVN